MLRAEIAKLLSQSTNPPKAWQKIGNRKDAMHSVRAKVRRPVPQYSPTTGTVHTS
jgi:hypothetical protein